ncbi:MAG: hypothetical protein WCA37_10520, partial [Terracidiphilus sp.]
PCNGRQVYDTKNKLTGVMLGKQMGICHVCRQEVSFELNEAGNYVPANHPRRPVKPKGTGYGRR